MTRRSWPRQIAVVAVAALVLMTPSLLWGPGAADSAIYNYVWTKQFGELLGQGVLYPRWLPHSWGGLGSPAFYFYPPLAFYVSGLLDLAGLTTLQAINGAALLAMFASGVTMSAWLRFKGANPLWALLYMAAPYHLYDWYGRAGLAEFSAFAWLPLVALGLDAQPRRWATPLLAISFAGLVMTHLPAALLTSVGLIAPMVVRRREHLAAYAFAGFLGLGLSAIYLLPALTLQHHISTAAMISSIYRPANWAPWGPYAALWVAPFALAPVSLAAGGRRWFWVGAVVFGAAMSLAVIPMVWSLPGLDRVQFPWRMLVVVEFAAVTAAALGPPRLVFAALALALSAVPYARLFEVSSQALHLRYAADTERDLPDAPEYLPAGSDLSGLTASNRVPDLNKAATPTLSDRPVPQTRWGAWISGLSLVLLAAISGPRPRPRARVKGSRAG